MIFAPQVVRLWGPEVRRCCFVGFCRNFHAEEDGREDVAGFDGDGVAAHSVGCFGEMAFCKLTGRRWEGKIDEYGSPDVDADIGIRTRPGPRWDAMIIRPRDKDSYRYVSVFGSPPYLTILGWMTGEEAKSHNEWRQTHAGRPPAWFVETKYLHKDLSAFL